VADDRDLDDVAPVLACENKCAGEVARSLELYELRNGLSGEPQG
jgi:hypothetical protein